MTANVVLKVTSLRKSYRQGDESIDVLRGIDLQLNQGETVAIIGPSGSGKSTLLSLLAGLDQASEGEITLKGKRYEATNQNEMIALRRDHIGFIFQQFHLIKTMTALENIALPLALKKYKNCEELAFSALERMGMSHRSGHRPAQLSGGEAQRVAIARAFVANPSMILADEPSGNLDSETGASVMEQLFKMIRSEKSSMLLVTHNEKHAVLCDRILELKAGVLVSHTKPGVSR